MSKPRLSVAMGTYNGASYLPEQLESIASQDRPPDELVACDDGSSDGTPELLRAFSRDAPFEVRIYENPSNLGVARNFERAMSLCRGELIAPCDQDDVWLPGKLARLEAALESSGAAVAFCDAEVVDEGLRPLGYTLWESVGFDPEETGGRFARIVRRNFVTGACMMLRAEALERTLPIHRGWVHDYWISAILGALGHELFAVDERLVRYRQHESQEIGALRGDVFRRARRGIQTWSRTTREEKSRLESLEGRLAELRVPRERLEEVSRKRRYFEARSGLQKLRRAERAVPIARLLLSGDYARYASRLDDLAKDVLVERGK